MSNKDKSTLKINDNDKLKEFNDVLINFNDGNKLEEFNKIIEMSSDDDSSNERYLESPPNNKNLEDAIKDARNIGTEALKSSKTTRTIVIALFIAVSLAFIGWIITIIVYEKEVTKSFLEDSKEIKVDRAKLEQQSVILDEKYNILDKKIDSLDIIIQDKVEKEVNKALLEFYKTQGELKK